MDYNYAKLLCLAVDQQNIQIIEQILIIKKKFNKILIQSCFKNACIKGYIDVIKIIITIPTLNITYKNNVTFKWSCFHGQLITVKWFMENTSIPIDHNFYDALLWSTEGNSIEIMEYLLQFIDHEINKPLSTYCKHYYLINKCIYRSIGRGYVKLFKWLYDKYDLKQCLNGYFDIACQYGQLEICKCIDKINLHIKHKKISHRNFNALCVNGHLNIIQWLNTDAQMNSISNVELCFEDILCAGQLELCKWLLAIDSKGFVNYIHKYKNVLFRKLIKRKSVCNRYNNKQSHKNNLHIMKWLYKICDDIDVCDDNNYIFKYCYYYGQLEICQWLYCVCPKIIHATMNKNTIYKYMIRWIHMMRLYDQEQNNQEQTNSILTEKGLK
jgi:hypothetical protein